MPPRRTCVACREEASPEDLVRLALHPDGTVHVDFRGRLPGRGGWAHPACLAVVEKKPGMLKRSLRVVPAPGPWTEEFRSAVHRALDDGLSQASAAGALVGGGQLLHDALRKGRAVAVILSSDIAAGSEKKVRAAAGDTIPLTRIHLDTATLGERVGKGPRSAIAVLRSRAASHLLRQLRRLRALG